MLSGETSWCLFSFFFWLILGLFVAFLSSSRSLFPFSFLSMDPVVKMDSWPWVLVEFNEIYMHHHHHHHVPYILYILVRLYQPMLLLQLFTTMFFPSGGGGLSRGCLLVSFGEFFFKTVLDLVSSGPAGTSGNELETTRYCFDTL